jgi:hypothetical protein
MIFILYSKIKVEQSSNLHHLMVFFPARIHVSNEIGPNKEDDDVNKG